MLDFHNHLIPGVDDGASTLEESLSGIENMRAQGVTHVITTPHFQASLLSQPAKFEAAMASIDESWRMLSAAVSEAFPDFVLSRAVELALDEPLDTVDDDRLRLAGSRFVLVEFPYFTVPPNSAEALQNLVRGGITPIVAHPERYRNLDPQLGLLERWKEAGAYLQLNAGSVVGAYGRRIEERAWKCLQMGLINYLCSDYHSRGQCLLEPARAALIDRNANAQLSLLGRINGDRLSQGLAPQSVFPLDRELSMFKRFVAAVRRKT
jgi:protein-tyrosine phosphatase